MQIETERCVLRYFTMEDQADLYEILGDKETMKYMENPYDEEMCANFLWDFCVARKNAVACVLKEKQKVIGYLLCKELNPSVYEIGWAFNRKYWRCGYAYEATQALINYVFKELKAEKVCAETIDVEKSVTLMKKLGMKREGILRKHTLDPQGNRVDFHLYGILKEEYDVL